VAGADQPFGTLRKALELSQKTRPISPRTVRVAPEVPFSDHMASSVECPLVRDIGGEDSDLEA
jgi:hypothetical protein